MPQRRHRHGHRHRRVAAAAAGAAAGVGGHGERPRAEDAEVIVHWHLSPLVRQVQAPPLQQRRQCRRHLGEVVNERAGK